MDRRGFRLLAFLRNIPVLLANEFVVNGVRRTNVETASTAETVSGKQPAGNAAPRRIQWTGTVAGPAIGATAVIDFDAENANSLK